MTNLRVAIDARTMFAAHRRGIGRYVANLVTAISTEHDNITFGLFGERGSTMPPNTDDKFTCFFLPNRGYRFHLWEQLYLPMSLCKTRFNLIHSPANTSPLFVPCKRVVTIHDLNLLKDDDRKDRSYSKYFRFMLPLLLKFSDKIITVSKSTARDIVNYYPDTKRSKITTIYNGIDPRFSELSSDRIKQRLDSLIDLNVRYILTIGASDTFKGTELVINAFCKVAAYIPHVLIVTGLTYGERDRYLRRALALGLEKRILMLGYVSDEELVALYNLCDTFIFASKYEGFGFPVLEAMKCGANVVASDIDTTREISGGFATLFKTENVEDLCEKIMTSSWVREAKRKKQTEWASRFTWENAARLTADVYNQVLLGTESV